LDRHNLVEMNLAMRFDSFDASHDYFRRIKALDENASQLSLASVTTT